MKRKVFVTLMTNCNALGITKDVGQIPYAMSKYQGYSSYLVTYNDDDYQKWIDTYTPGLKVKYMKKSHNSEIYDECIFIIKNARKIDVLNMYHMSVGHLLCLYLYKLINPQGISFLKLDIDFPGIEGHSRLSKWKKRIITILHKGVDILSAESKSVCEKYEEIFDVKPQYIPVGYADIGFDFNNRYTKKLNKENIIMTAGRLGTKQKATEILLEAFSKAKNVNDWKLILAGSITDELKRWLVSFYSKNPNIEEKIVFTGNIIDKNELYSLMRKTKIFAMPSRWGGSEIAAVEALVSGAYLLLSDRIPPCEEYTNYGKYGIKVPVDDVGAWSKAIDDAVDLIESGYDYEEQEKYGIGTFNWKTISDILNECIKCIEDKKNLFDKNANRHYGIR